jgi:ABC-2 type transport system ATP-binding protein
MKDVAVSIKNVKKQFNLPHEKMDSLKSRLISLFKHGKKGGSLYKALNGVTLDIKKNEFIGILGRNGAGKSTLLKIIAEIYTPTSGSVKVHGKMVPFIELGVGFNPNLSGRDNVYLNGAMLGFDRPEIDRMYSSIVDFAELHEFMDQKLKNYSSGMKVRLAFSMAIRADADILLLDEVLAVGDASFQQKCYEYFDSLKDNKKTIIFVSHNMSAVRKYCDRGVLIEGGKVAFVGTGEEAADEYLRLFGKNAAAAKESERWGDKALTIQDFKVKVTDDNLKISAILAAGEHEADGVKFGFRIKDTKGRVLIGANNLNVNEGKALNFKAQEVKKVDFTLPNILSNQAYTISATINSSDSSVTHDWWEDIVSIRGKREGRYPLVAPATLSVSSDMSDTTEPTQERLNTEARK